MGLYVKDLQVFNEDGNSVIEHYVFSEIIVQNKLD